MSNYTLSFSLASTFIFTTCPAFLSITQHAILFFRFFLFLFDLYFLISSRGDLFAGLHCCSCGNDIQKPRTSLWLTHFYPYFNTEFIRFRNRKIFSTIELSSQGLASEPVNFSRHGSAERSVYLMIITVLCSAGEKKRVVGEILRDFQYIPFLVNLQKFCFGTKCLTCCLKNSTQGDSTKIEESCLTFSIYFLWEINLIMN